MTIHIPIIVIKIVICAIVYSVGRYITEESTGTWNNGSYYTGCAFMIAWELIDFIVREFYKYVI